MNQLIVRAALGVSLFAASLAPAGAQMVPSGSYQQSCIGIHVQNGQLVARCTEPQGDRIRSSIALGSCRGGDIANSNGQLVCNGGNGYRQRGNGNGNGYGGNNGYGSNGGYGNGGNAYGRAPGGSYQQSCSSARMGGGQLTASCPDGNGNMRTSSIDPRTCRGADIANRNGRLSCS